MNFIEDFMNEINKVPTYEATNSNGNLIKTIECSVVCDILSVLFDKYGLEDSLHDDLHG